MNHVLSNRLLIILQEVIYSYWQLSSFKMDVTVLQSWYHGEEDGFTL